jgi:hypothetical protein
LGIRPSDHGWTARAALVHPVWWASALMLLLNDHYLKGGGVLAAWVTGKLSDFVGLLMAPVVVAAVVAPRSRLGFRFAHLAVGALFALLKLSPACAAAWCTLGGVLGMTWRVVSDPTDLLALPMLVVSWQLFGRVRVAALLQAWQRLVATAGAGVGLVGTVATSRPPPRAPVLTPKAVLIAIGDQAQELNRDTGKPGRRIDCNLDWVDRPMIVNGVLYAGSYPGVRACDLNRGVTMWKRELDSWCEIAHADSERVIARSREKIWALAASNGAVLWHLDLANLRVVASPGRLTIQGLEGNLKVVAPEDGRTLSLTGELPPGVNKELFGSRWQAWRFPSASDPSKEPELVFVHQGMFCGQNRLTALTSPQQVPLWSIPWCPWDESAVVDDTLLVTQSGSAKGLRVVARVPRTGQVLWRTLVDD